MKKLLINYNTKLYTKIDSIAYKQMNRNVYTNIVDNLYAMLYFKFKWSMVDKIKGMIK